MSCQPAAHPPTQSLFPFQKATWTLWEHTLAKRVPRTAESHISSCHYSQGQIYRFCFLCKDNFRRIRIPPRDPFPFTPPARTAQRVGGLPCISVNHGRHGLSRITKTKKTGLIRYANAVSVMEKTLASPLADAFSQHLPAWRPCATRCFLPTISA